MRILLATDGADGSTGAIRLTASLATEPGNSVTMLHVLEPLVVHGPPSAQLLVAPDPQIAEERKAAARKRLGSWLADQGPAGAWPLEVEIGPVPVTIVDAAETGEATLIVLGSGRHDRLERWFGTETALRVAQLSHVPVLAVPEGTGGRPKNVLAAVDFSDFSRDAVTAAITLREPGARLHLAHVLWPQPADIVAIDKDWTADIRKRSRQQLDEWAGTLDLPSTIQVEKHLLEGNAAEDLLKLGEQIGADLIAAGSHGLGFFGRLLLGSVSTRLLRGATCPVLIAPPRERAREMDARDAPASADLG